MIGDRRGWLYSDAGRADERRLNAAVTSRSLSILLAEKALRSHFCLLGVGDYDIRWFEFHEAWREVLRLAAEGVRRRLAGHETPLVGRAIVQRECGEASKGGEGLYAAARGALYSRFDRAEVRRLQAVPSYQWRMRPEPGIWNDRRGAVSAEAKNWARRNAVRLFPNLPADERSVAVNAAIQATFAAAHWAWEAASRTNGRAWWEEKPDAEEVERIAATWRPIVSAYASGLWVWFAVGRVAWAVLRPVEGYLGIASPGRPYVRLAEDCLSRSRGVRQVYLTPGANAALVVRSETQVDALLTAMSRSSNGKVGPKSIAARNAARMFAGATVAVRVRRGRIRVPFCFLQGGAISVAWGSAGVP